MGGRVGGRLRPSLPGLERLGRQRPYTPRHSSAAPIGASMSWAWRHSWRMAGGRVTVVGRGVGGCGTGRVRGRGVRFGGSADGRGTARTAGFAAFPGFGPRCRDADPAGRGAAVPPARRPSPARVGPGVGRPCEPGSVTASSSYGTGGVGAGRAGRGVGGRSAAGASSRGPGCGRGAVGCGTATQPAVRSTDSRRNVVRRGCMAITLPDPAGAGGRLGPGPPSRVNPVTTGCRAGRPPSPAHRPRFLIPPAGSAPGRAAGHGCRGGSGGPPPPAGAGSAGGRGPVGRAPGGA